jgi:hypothetical protein
MSTMTQVLDGLQRKAERENANEFISLGDDGWSAFPGTWTYASATTFTITGDYRSWFPTGTKIKLTQTTAKYFYVVAVSYGAPNTTVTVCAGSDYSLANAAITEPNYSYQASPRGFPTGFAWALVPGGFASGSEPTGVVARFALQGAQATVWVYMPNTGVSNSTTITVGLPTGLVAKNSGENYHGGAWRLYDNGVALTTPAVCILPAGGATISIYRDSGGGGFNTVLGKRASINLTFEAA